MSETTPSGANEQSASLDRAFVEDFYPRFLAIWNMHDTTDLPEFITEDVAWADPC